MTLTRLTRAALRAQEDANTTTPPFHKDVDASRSSLDSDFEHTDLRSSKPTPRPILAEITGNDIPAPVDMPAKKRKGRKATKGKKAKSDPTFDDMSGATTVDEALQDGNKNDTSSTPDAEPEDLKVKVNPLDIGEAPIDMARARSSASAVSRETGGSLSRSPKESLTAVRITTLHPATPRFDPIIHKDMMEDESDASCRDEHKDDSFVESIKNRSPIKVIESHEQGADETDSFVEDIISRSTTKQGARIEDSIEEMDAQEEAMERISQGLHKLEGSELESPVKTRTSVGTGSKLTPTRMTAAATAVATKLPTTDVKASTPSARSFTKPSPAPLTAATTPLSTIKPTATRASVATVAKPLKAAITTDASSKPVKVSSSTSASSTAADHTAPGASGLQKRNTSSTLSTSKPGFVPQKSTKPPTKSTFVLPGEAIAAKLKAQREERMKKEEEAEQKKVFKARSVPAKVMEKPKSGLPKETATSRARMSLVIGAVESKKDGRVEKGSVRSSLAPRRLQADERSGKENLAPVSQRATTQSGSRGVTAKRQTEASSLAARKVSDVGASRPGSTRANSSARRITAAMGRRASTAAAPATKTATLSEVGLKSTITKTDVVHQRARGKEIFGRDKVEKEQRAKEQREKEEAAKKARIEAAVRGREESRKWAERQKRKLKGDVQGGNLKAMM